MPKAKIGDLLQVPEIKSQEEHKLERKFKRRQRLKYFIDP
jgi:hypothetical protein